MATRSEVLDLLADSERPAGGRSSSPGEKATRDSVLRMLDDGDDESSAIDPQAKTTREDLIRMLDEGEAEILPPRPTTGTHRGTGVATDPLPAPPSRRVADPVAAGATAFGIANPTAIEVQPPDEEVAPARCRTMYAPVWRTHVTHAPPTEMLR